MYFINDVCCVVGYSLYDIYFVFFLINSKHSAVPWIVNIVFEYLF